MPKKAKRRGRKRGRLAKVKKEHLPHPLLEPLFDGDAIRYPTKLGRQMLVLSAKADRAQEMWDWPARVRKGFLQSVQKRLSQARFMDVNRAKWKDRFFKTFGRPQLYGVARGRCEVCRKKGRTEKAHIVQKAAFAGFGEHSKEYYASYTNHALNVLFLCPGCHSEMDHDDFSPGNKVRFRAMVQKRRRLLRDMKKLFKADEVAIQRAVRCLERCDEKLFRAHEDIPKKCLRL